VKNFHDRLSQLFGIDLKQLGNKFEAILLFTNGVCYEGCPCDVRFIIMMILTL